MKCASSALVGVGLAALLGGAAAGCELSRPEGAYYPAVDDAGRINSFDEDKDAGEVQLPDASAGFNEDVNTPQDDKHLGLVGIYMARFDEHSVNISSTPVGSKSATTRVSRFFLIKIEENDAQELISTEQMCGQVTEATCMTDCSSTTRIYPEAAAKIPGTLPIVRKLELNENTGALNAINDQSTAVYLGYKATASDHALPTSVQDARIWTSSVANGQGLYTELVVSVDTGILGTSGVTCQMNVVQELHLAWTAYTDPKNSGEFKLDGSLGNVFITDFGSGANTDTKILDATANPSSNRNDCLGKSGNMGTVTPGPRTLQFKKVGMQSKCPSVSMFESMIPADAKP